ncbi:DNA replication endonuclease-helicase Dna2 [Coemansia sp. RSA 1804]|nr:DNA replication endonuclease-helicase Dna2 [Coemansia sp. RSA 1804]
MSETAGGDSNAAETPQKRRREGLFQRAASAVISGAERPSDQTDVPQKRTLAAAIPCRHHSAGSPLSVSEQQQQQQTAPQRIAGPVDNSADDVIFWQSMSPQGTLSRVLRHKETESMDEPVLSSDQQDALGGRSTASLMQGIVQQIIASRHTSAINPSPTSAAKKTSRALADLAAASPTKRSRSSRITGTLKHGSSDLGSDADIQSPLFDMASIESMPPSIELTPLANRRRKAVPRPLTISKSERVVDKRQMLSTLLLSGPSSADSPSGIAPMDISTPNLWVKEESNVPQVSFADDPFSTEKHGNIVKHFESVRDHDLTPVKAPKSESTSQSNLDDICFDDIDMDDILGDLDQLDDGLDDLLKDVEAEAGSGGIECGSRIEQKMQNPQADQLASSDNRLFKRFEKCLTLLVTEDYYTFTQSHAPSSTFGSRMQKVVRVYSQTAVCERVILLRDEWYSTPIATGDYINLVGDITPNALSSDGEVIIDTETSNSLLPILHPDVLIACTHLADSFSCIRRAALKDRVREIPDGSPPNTVMLIGTLLHDLFQSCALSNSWDDVTMSATIWSLIAENVACLWECQMDESSVYQQISECVPVYQAWAKGYMHRYARNGSQYSIHRDGSNDCRRNQKTNGDPLDETKGLAISKVINIEENVWSPRFGLKGKIDLTVLAQYTCHGALVEPFELKTGRITENPTHRAQLILYTLLLSERYDLDIRSGLLYYPRSGETIRVPRFDDELRGLISARNTMVQYLMYKPQVSRPLPDMLGNEFMCDRCAFKPTCFTVHKAMECGTAKTARVADTKWEDQVSHLSGSHMEFIQLWMGLIDGEESDMVRYRAELWNMASAHREYATGRCIAGLKLDTSSVQDTQIIGSFNRYRLTFYPSGESGSEKEFQKSLQDSQLSVGDPIIVSSEPDQYALTVGYVSALEFNHIVVAVDRPVRGVPKRVGEFDSSSNQDFECIMEIRQRGPMDTGMDTVIHPDVPESAARDMFRIDKDEMSNAISRVRASLMRMFVISGGNARCRRLIVDLQQPEFLPLHENVEKAILKIQQDQQLNSGQELVLRKVLSAKDYALVMGMPGTGKTTTIAELVRVLVSLGKSVLLTSYTHIAVDNVLLRLQKYDFPMIRLGNKAKVHPQVVKYLPSETKLESVKQYDSYFRGAKVVATTCLGVSHPIFAMRKFDYCIVDEASQITLPVCLGPLLEAERFVLVGDHHQLPPLVRNTSSRDRGMGISLFKRLCEAHPSAVVRLEYQYRMNSDIQRLANNLIYDGHLRCGSSKVADQRIQYKVDPSTAICKKWPNLQPNGHQSIGRDMSWATSVLDAQRGAVFVDTDSVPGHETRMDGSDLVMNEVEIKIIKVLTSVLQGCGVEGRQVSILSPYRTQLKQLEIEYGIRIDEEGSARSSAEKSYSSQDKQADSENIANGSAVPQQSLQRTSEVEEETAQSKADDGRFSGIEVHTIDRYQGRDADIIIISFVRSNSAQAIGDLLRDWHRINVAITRARYKLIMIGSQKTLRRSPLFSGMFRMLNVRNSVITIPKLAPIPATITTSAAGNNPQRKKHVATTMGGEVLLKKMHVVGNIVAEQQ